MEEKMYAKAMGQLHTNEIGVLRTQFHKNYVIPNSKFLLPPQKVVILEVLHTQI